jgi:CelD/BcsL family acetyltransferase involved in cellulose biosynthesis
MADVTLIGQAMAGRAPAEQARAASRNRAGNIELSVHYDLAAIEPLWRQLQDNGACTVFQSYEWLSVWQRHFGAHHNIAPCIVVARDANGAALFMLPLAVETTGFTRTLTWLGSDLCDYNAPLLGEDAGELEPGKMAVQWRAIVARLQADPRSRHDLVRLEKMPPAIGGRPNPMLALSSALNPSGSYVTPLMDSWDAFYSAKRSSSTRRRDRSKRSHLGEFGEVKFVSADDTAAALDVFGVLVEQKTKTFERHGIRNLFARPGYLDFYREIAGSPATAKLVHISKLQVGEQVAATNLGLVFGGSYYHVLASYTDNELSRRGPGAAHLNDLLRYAIERGLSVFDFTIGDERYKRDWCDEVQSLHDYVAVASWRGMASAGPAILLTRLKRTIKQTPMLWAMVVKARAIMASFRKSGAPEAVEPDSDAK